MSWFLVGGAAVGAGVGSYGHDNWGWSKDAIWQGAGVGAAGGWAMAPGAGAGTTALGGGNMLGTGTGVGGTAIGGAATPTVTAGLSPGSPSWMAAEGNAFLGIGAETAGGMSGSTAMQYGILGASALSAFSGGQAGGFAPQEKIELTGPGKELYKGLRDVTEEKRKNVEAGDITNLARNYIPGMLKKEGAASRKGEMALTGRLGSSGDTKSKVGTTQGGSTSKQALAKAGARVDALSAPGEWMGTNIKEEYSNVLGGERNLMNLEQQAPMLTAQASIARNSAELANRSSQGSAYANLARMGGMMSIMNKVQ